MLVREDWVDQYDHELVDHQNPALSTIRVRASDIAVVIRSSCEVVSADKHALPAYNLAFAAAQYVGFV